MTEVARADIGVAINDAEAIAGIRNVDREFDRAMRHVDGKRAEAIISADLKPLKARLKEAEAEVKAWEARRKKQGDALSKSEAASYGWSKRRLASAQREVSAHQNLLSLMQDENKALALSDRAERALEASTKRRVREADKLAQIRAKEAEAARVHWLNEYKGTEQVAKLNREYKNLAKNLETVQRRKKRTVLGTEVREEVTLDEHHIKAKMARIIEELRLMGKNPPVKIRVDTDRRDVGFVRNQLFSLQQAAARTLEKVASIGHVRLSLGPFSGTLRTMTIAVAALSPIISSTVLALSSLVGVLGAGISGAAAVGTAGLVGMGMGFLGLKFASRNSGQEIANVRTAMGALQKAQEKYGDSSEKAKKKQKELNNTLKHVSPLARETALGIEAFYTNWDKHSRRSRNNLGGIAKDGFEALNKITPMWAKRTNDMSGILRRNLAKGFDFLSHGEGKNTLDTIMGNFNKSLPALLRGFGAFGHAFLNFGKEGSRFLPMMNRGFESLGNKLLDFTQRDDFGDTIKRWVKDGRDLMRFFGAAGRVMMHFFGDGSEAGDKFLNSMTGALDRWDKFLTSDAGKDRMGGMFDEAVKSTISLSHALGPLLKSFSEWSTALAPITQGILDVISVVSRIIGMVTHVVALRGAFVALGAAIATAFALGKIVAFVNLLVRAYGLLKAMAVAESAAAMGGAGIFGRMKAAAQGGAAALAAQRAGSAAAGAAGAGGAAATGAATAARAEGAWVSLTAAEAEAGVAAGTAGTAGAAGAGLMATAAIVALPAIVALGAAYIAVKHNVDKHEAAVRALTRSDDKMNAGIVAQTEAEKVAVDSHKRYAAAVGTIKDAQKDLNALHKRGKDGTNAMIDAEARLFRATQRRNDARADFVAAAQKEVNGVKQQRAAQEELINTRKKELAQAQINAAMHGHDADSLAKVAKAASLLRAEENILNAVEARATTASLNHQRALRGVAPIAQSAAVAVGMFAQKFGKIPNVKKILLSANTSQLAKITNLSKQVDKSVGTKATKNILVNAKGADDAIRKMEAIQALHLSPKHLFIDSPNAGRTLVQLAKIEGVKLSPKTVKALMNGDADVLRRIAKILGIKLGTKTAHVQALGVDQARAQIQAVKNAIDSLHDKTVTLTTNNVTRSSGGGTFKHVGGVRASGGPVAVTDKRAAQKADAANKTRGGKHSKPTFLVGEERRPEYVIATNPAYRDRNVQYWMQAAKALGIPGFATGGSYGKHGAKDSPKDYGYYANLGKTKPLPAVKKVPKGKGKKAKKKRAKLVKSDDPYARRVNKLLGQQTDIEREISIRQNEQMERPDSFLIEGKDENGDPTYTINQKAVDDYGKSFDPIIEAQKALVTVVAEIVATIPKAIKSLTQRRALALKNQTAVGKSLRKNEASLKTESRKKKPDKGKINYLRDRIAREKKALAFYKKRAGVFKDDLNQMREAKPEAGFDWREAVDELHGSQADKAAVLTDSAQDLKDAQESAADKGKDDPGLTMAQQQGLAITEMQTALRDYGSNFQTPGSFYGENVSPGAEAFGGGQGVQGNQSMGGINTTNAVANALGGSTAMSSGSSGAVGSSFTGAAQASRAMAPTGTAAPSLAGAGTTDASKTVNITNNYETMPEDPHTWSQGVAFEVAAAV